MRGSSTLRHPECTGSTGEDPLLTTLPQEVTRCLDLWLGCGWSAVPLAGDASIRAYYRVSSERGTFVAAWYPEDVRSQMARFLTAHQAIVPYARVPEIFEHTESVMLQEDVGDRSLLDALRQDRDEGVRLYRDAVDLLVAFQETRDPGILPPFTGQYFLSELEMAREFYVERLMNSDGGSLIPWIILIAEKVSQHPYRICHRDYHGQNIHVINGSLILFDYQDIRMGPDTYDLASLLRDRGVASVLGDDLELELLDRYAAGGKLEGNVRVRYFEALLQRSIKILGTFSKQPIVRGKMHYLDFIPPTLASIRRCLDELPQFEPVRDMFPLSFDLEVARRRARELNGSI